jgi:nitrate/nitrite-specific signal transduction histidine kinase
MNGSPLGRRASLTRIEVCGVILGIRWRSLAAKIVAWFFVPTAIILGAVALVNYYAYRQVTEDLVIERDAEVTRLTASQLGVKLADYAGLLTALSRTSDIYSGDPDRQGDALRASANRLGMFDGGLIILDTFGQVTLSEPERPEAIGVDWSDQEYYREVLGIQISGPPHPIFSNVLPDGSQGSPVVAVAVPIVGDQLEFLGVLTGLFRVDSSQFGGFYVDIPVGNLAEGDAIYVIDRAGNLIFHTQTDRIGGSIDDDELLSYVSSEDLGAVRFKGAAGEDKLVSYARVPGTPWRLVAEAEWGSLTRAGSGYQRDLLMLLALGIVVPAVVVFVGVRRVMKPIQALIIAAKEVAQGQFGGSIEAKTGDEIEELATQFNRMSDELARSYRTLEQRVEDRTRELSVLNAIAGVVSRSLDLEEILSNALEKTLDLMGIEAGGIYLLDDESGLLSIAAYRGFNASFSSEIDQLRVGEGFSGQVAERGEPLIVDDISTDPRLSRSIAKEEGFHSFASFPLQSRGTVVGTLFVITRQHRAFPPQEIELLTSIGNQIGVAVENARLYEDVTSRLAQVIALQETSAAVVSTLALDELLTLLTRKAMELLYAEGGVLNLVDWETREDEVVAATGSLAPSVGYRSPLDHSLSGWVALHNHAVALKEGEEDPRVDQGALTFLQKELGREIGSIAAAPLAVKDRVLGSLVLMTKAVSGKEFSPADLDILVSFASQAAGAIENARLFAAEQRRAEEFQVISEVGRRVTSIMPLDELLKQIVQLIQGTFGYYIVEIGLVEDRVLVYQAGVGGNWEKEYERFSLALDRESVTGWAAVEGTALLIPDVRHDSRYRQLFDTGTRSELAVPLKSKDKVIGVLNVESDRPADFDESDVTVLRSLANQAAIAIENAMLYEQSQRSAALEERQRLARDLHDAVTQTLFSASLIAEVLPRLWERDPQEGVQRLTELRQLTRGALAEMRTLLVELMPAALADAELRDLLRHLTEATIGRSRVAIDLDIQGDRPMSPEVKIAFYRIAQEALNNMAKHSGATHTMLSLKSTSEEVTLRIADNGRGFDPSTVPVEHLGLSIMQERAANIGAELTVDAAPGAGTEITLVWRAQEETGE